MNSVRMLENGLYWAIISVTAFFYYLDIVIDQKFMITQIVIFNPMFAVAHLWNINNYYGPDYVSQVVCGQAVYQRVVADGAIGSL